MKIRIEILCDLSDEEVIGFFKNVKQSNIYITDSEETQVEFVFDSEGEGVLIECDKTVNH